MDSRPGSPWSRPTTAHRGSRQALSPWGHIVPQRGTAPPLQRWRHDGIAPREEACRPHRRSRGPTPRESTKAARLEAGATKFWPIGKLIPRGAQFAWGKGG